MNNLKLPYKWNINISSLKNPLLWFQLLLVSFLPALFLLLFLVGLNLFEYHWQYIPDSIITAAIIGSGLFLVFSLIMLLMYGRGIPTKYVLKNKYIEQHTLSRGSKMAGILSFLGIFSGKNAGYTAAGATMLAKSREVIAVNWKDINHLEVFPERKEIRLHNDWRTVMQIICPDKQFDIILRFIKDKTKDSISLQKSINTVTKETSLAYKVMLTILSLTLGILLMPKLPIRIIGIFSIAIIIFAFLALWWSGIKKRVASVILFLLPFIGAGLSFALGYINMSRQGTVYALVIETLLLAYFILLGLAIFFRRIN